MIRKLVSMGLVIAVVLVIARVAAAQNPSTTISVHACTGTPTPQDMTRVFEVANIAPTAISAGNSDPKKSPFTRCSTTLDVDQDIATHKGGALANSDQWVEIYFYKSDANGNSTVVSPGEAKFAKVEVSSGGDILFRKDVAFSTTVDVPLSDLKSLPHLSLVKVSTFYNDNNKPDDRYFRIYRRFSKYGIADKETIFWLPVGMLGTSFKRNDNGYAFSVFPVSLAAGVRMAVTDSFYVGGSLMFDYTIYRGAPGMGTMQSSDVSLSGAAVGALIDIDNYLYIGYGYVFDWGKDAPNPGSTLVIGAGPGLIQYLQGKK